MKTTLSTSFARAAITLLMTLCLTTTIHAGVLAVYSNDNHTLFFTKRNGLETSLSQGGLFTPEGGSRSLNVAWYYQIESVDAESPYWGDRSDLGDVQKVVFESSFADVKPTMLNSWFRGFSGLKSMDGLENFNTSETRNMNMMFANCTSLTSLSLNYFNTAKVTTMNSMFHGCTNLINLYISSFNTANVTSMTGMFAMCEQVVGIYIGDGWTTANVQSSGSMFQWCKKIVGQDGTTYDSSVTDKRKAHAGSGGYMRKQVLYQPAAVYCADSKAMYFTRSFNPNNAYYSPEGGTETYSVAAYWYDTDVTETGEYPEWYRNYSMKSNVTTVAFEPSFNSVKPISTKRWFMDFTKLSSVLRMNNLNTSDVTNIEAMFYGCARLTSLDLTDFVTGKVTEMSSMFGSCTALTTLDLSSFDTGKVNQTAYMFKGCSKLKSIYIGTKWNLSRVSDIGSIQMFQNCTDIVGQDGTTYDSNYTNKTKAHADAGGYMRVHTTPLTLYDGSDNTSLITSAMESDGYYDVTLSGRMLYKDGSWNTLCLPFDLKATQIATMLESPEKIMTLDNASIANGTLTMNFKEATSIEAGKPYIIKWAKADDYVNDKTHNLYQPTFKAVRVSKDLADITTDGVTFKGLYKPLVIAKSGDRAKLYLGADNKLYFAEISFNINAFHGYFQLGKDMVISNLGDVNGDRNLNVTDVTCLVNKILGIHESHFIFGNADINGDGQVTVTDVTEMVNLILNNSRNIYNVVVNTDGSSISFEDGGSGPARERKIGD